jgi:hypothetical protein
MRTASSLGGGFYLLKMTGTGGSLTLILGLDRVSNAIG